MTMKRAQHRAFVQFLVLESMLPYYEVANHCYVILSEFCVDVELLDVINPLEMVPSKAIGGLVLCNCYSYLRRDRLVDCSPLEWKVSMLSCMSNCEFQSAVKNKAKVGISIFVKYSRITHDFLHGY